MGSASTELTAVVLTTPLTGKHNLAEPGLLNSAIVYSSFLPDLTSSGRSQLGLTPGAGSTLSARGSWSKTGRGTGLPWTTSSSTIRRPNFEKLTNDACCRMQPSTFCRLLGWALLYRNIAHPREADIVRFRIMVLRACMYVCFLHFNLLLFPSTYTYSPLRSLPGLPMWQPFRSMICDNLIGNGSCNSLHEFYTFAMQMNPLMYILLCNVVNRSVLCCKWFMKKQMPFLVIVSWLSG